jgi:hypothetical protein
LIHRYADAWIHGRIHGYMDTGIHGYMGTRMHGYMDGFMDTGIHGYIDTYKLQIFLQNYIHIDTTYR